MLFGFYFFQAYKQGLLYPKYQLLLYGWYSDGWWIETDLSRDLGCTQQELNRAVLHAMAPIQAEFYSNKSLPTEGNLVILCYVSLCYMQVVIIFFDLCSKMHIMSTSLLLLLLCRWPLNMRNCTGQKCIAYTMK